MLLEINELLFFNLFYYCYWFRINNFSCSSSICPLLLNFFLFFSFAINITVKWNHNFSFFRGYFLCHFRENFFFPDLSTKFLFSFRYRQYMVSIAWERWRSVHEFGERSNIFVCLQDILCPKTINDTIILPKNKIMDRRTVRNRKRNRWIAL